MKKINPKNKREREMKLYLEEQFDPSTDEYEKALKYVAHQVSEGFINYVNNGFNYEGPPEGKDREYLETRLLGYEDLDKFLSDVIDLVHEDAEQSIKNIKSLLRSKRLNSPFVSRKKSR